MLRMKKNLRRSVLAALLLAACDLDPGLEPLPDEELAAAAGASGSPVYECGDETHRRWVEFDPNLADCPAADACLQITDASTLPQVIVLAAACEWKGVSFRITRSNTTLDCNGATLTGTDKSGPNHAISVVGPSRLNAEGSYLLSWRDVDESVPCVDRQEPVDGPCGDYELKEEAETQAEAERRCSMANPEIQSLSLHDVTVRNCTVKGNYGTGVLVEMDSFTPSASDRYTNIYMTHFNNEHERNCRLNRIDDCLRAAAPGNIRIENVDIHNVSGNGLHLFGWVHDVTFTGGSIIGVSGVGAYLSPGSRRNRIENSEIRGNRREGIALDASSCNLVRRNEISRNSQHSLDDWRWWWHYDVGITIFKNAWEGRAGDNAGPRNQHASRNRIERNDIENQRTGVWIGYRQGMVRDGVERGDPIYVSSDEENYHKKYSESNEIFYNRFISVVNGLEVQDDGAQIIGNSFLREADSDTSGVAIDIGHDVRRRAGEPVTGTVVSNNLIDPHHRFDIREQDCAFGNDIRDNSVGVPDGPRVPATETRDPCNFGKQVRLGIYSATDDGSFAPMGSLSSGSFFDNEQIWLAGDFDGDGTADALKIYESPDSRMHAWLHRAVGDKRFEYKSSFVALSGPTSDDPIHLPLDKNGKWVAGNFDGQFGDDIAYLYGEGNTTQVAIWTSFGTGFRPGVKREIADVKYDPSHRWLAGNVAGDAIDEFVLVYGPTTARVNVYRMRPPVVFGQFLLDSTRTLDAFRTNDKWLLGNFHGTDGYDDLLNVSADAAGKAHIAMHRNVGGTGFRLNSWLTPFIGSGSSLAGYWPAQRWLVANLDGDAYDDLVLIYGNQGTARVWRNRSIGSGLEHLGIQSLDNFWDDQDWLTGHFDDDDRDDLVLVYGKSWQ